MQSEPSQPVPVLPLPDVVLFPHALLPLRVTDLRHRTLVRDALSGERVITLALSKPGAEEDERGNPDVFPLGCLARVHEVEWLPDDCYDLKLMGVARVLLEREVRAYPYRAARVRIVPQEPYTEGDPLVQIERQASIRVFERLLSAAAAAARLPQPSVPGPHVSYESLVHNMCMCLDADAEGKLGLLGLDSVIERGKRARERIERRLGSPEGGKPGDGESN